MRLLVCVLSTVLGLCAQEAITGERIRAHIRFLASDLLEGRGVGTRGGELATNYIASQLAVAGAKPAGDNGTYFQKVELVGVEPQPSSTLGATKGGQSVSFAWSTEFVGNTMQQKTQAAFDAEAVFVGHGITAPEFDWNDYKGADLKGKVAVLFTNEPPSEDAKFFGGRALTYYGRWTYKYEEVLRQGAIACVLIHTTPTAGYGWEVVKSSWGKEDPQVKLGPGQDALAFAGWVSRAAGEKLLGLAGHTVDDLLKKADQRGFQPIPLGIRIRGTVPAKVRSIQAANVAAIVPGSDPVLSKEAVVFSAHWDHLGIGPAVNGDSIYNGAVDNASGCAVLIEIARAWADLRNRPKRSAIFVAVTAEESGLRGAEVYAARPVIPVGKTALNLNFDSFFPFGRVKDVVVNGAERTSVFPIVQQVAKRFNLAIKPDPRPEQGHYYRSDHFAFARAGVPAFSINMGDEYIGKDETAGAQMAFEYNAKNYHQPSDEYKESWDMGGPEQMARFGFTIGLYVANAPAMPTWRAGDEFLPARQKSQGQ
ncbi:MAG TPA: M28 family peptidase [Bryobacteraceae bacterium]|nr:M28 family peptidase [Bryobacteraceae bacterium]